MQSPITGKEMERHIRPYELVFRKETFPILYHYYWDKETGDEYTDEELDTINVNQVYNQYREKYNLPFPDQIKAIRDQYGLTQAKMAEVLGFGVNMYRQYENGEIPTLSNARLIQLAEDPAEFAKLINASMNILDDQTKQDLYLRINSLLKENQSFQVSGLPQYLMSGGMSNRASRFTGYKRPNLNKLIETIIFFAGELKPFKTQLNKLLFYSDFYHYKKTTTSITGAEYYAIQMGPVPNNFHSIFEYAATSKLIDIFYFDFGDGKCGEQFIARPDRKFNERLFSKGELESLNTILRVFGGKQTKQMIEISHDELAWSDNIEGKKKISYDYAFQLKHI
jgi:transcriptional regulator with XRE-family HTH domain